MFRFDQSQIWLKKSGETLLRFDQISGSSSYSGFQSQKKKEKRPPDADIRLKYLFFLLMLILGWNIFWYQVYSWNVLNAEIKLTLEISCLLRGVDADADIRLIYLFFFADANIRLTFKYLLCWCWQMSCMLRLILGLLLKYLVCWNEVDFRNILCAAWCWSWWHQWCWYQVDFGTTDKCTLTHNVMTRAQVEGMTAKLMSMSVRFLAGGNLSLHHHIWKTIFWKEKNWENKLAGGEKATLVAASSKTGTHSSQGADISQFTVNIRKSHSLHFIVPQLFAS